MSNLQLIPNGAVLVRNGVIEEAGGARRIENLAAAKQATEIDAAGGVVMPAFANADMELVLPPRGGAGIRVISGENALLRAGAVAAERARQGCLTVGARTAWAVDLRNTLKILRAQRSLQGRPLRIRSIYSHQARTPVDELIAKWLPAIGKDRLASVIEFNIEAEASARQVSLLHEAANAAATAGLAVRVRSPLPPAPETLELALSAGAISILSPLDSALNYLIPLATIGCVRIIPVMEGSDEGPLLASRVRGAIDEGASIALSPAHTPRDCPGSNGPGGMQSLLHLAVAQFGLTLEEAIVATTYNAVCSLRLSQTTGSIEPGKSADLLLMNVADYRDLAHGGHHNHPGSVMRAGQVLGALH